MSKTTLDLSTISDITDGTHTVKVKAKADGYRDSEFSNEVSYTKSSKHKVTFTRKQPGMDGRWQYSLTGGADWVVSDNITPTGDMSVIYYGDNNPV